MRNSKREVKVVLSKADYAFSDHQLELQEELSCIIQQATFSGLGKHFIVGLKITFFVLDKDRDIWQLKRLGASQCRGI